MFGCEERRSKNKLVQRTRDRIKVSMSLLRQKSGQIPIAKWMEMCYGLHFPSFIERWRDDEPHCRAGQDICGEMQNAEFEGSTQAGSMRTLKLRELTQQRVTELGKTALTMVRRAALQALLEHERQQYVIELNRLGKTIYKQRV
ncbi:unnamed protein product [Oncorhynchus mykiss]|uniref:Uncharacterized protein n=1 Tax=Oncorhynchus mykiss TaxID=8022 RepID=A0A060Y1E0_ONCMY|nr:unnamed protein product [Oncorhynchus mykiss]